MPFSEIKALPASGSTELVEPEGHRFQITTWCEQVAPDEYRVVVSSHKMRALGASLLIAAEGFTIDSSGRIERLAQQEVKDSFL
jgi:hypothetical protein